MLGNKVELRYNPYDLRRILVYDKAPFAVKRNLTK
ncbi:hypothetical protein GJ688_10365 [Heliobacillus mobilis]|uniref:Transposase-like Mu C-terminal domain-containing protein n=1 Tax=Heliobacterium mobile TaxID=28064 RepID=A0A6I3SKC5_HELMO|nr:Mu transposase C-terminal domain-containing protein [Heliobacterium mobile]MTV49381.1 hypothetical protein [Heliobacterium mobile]